MYINFAILVTRYGESSNDKHRAGIEVPVQCGISHQKNLKVPTSTC